MVRTPSSSRTGEKHQGDIWWLETEQEAGRPCLILTRDRAIGVLDAVLVAPITRTIRGIPTEISLDRSDGLPVDCVATMDNTSVVPKSALTHKVGALTPGRWPEVCAALRAATDC